MNSTKRIVQIMPAPAGWQVARIVYNGAGKMSVTMWPILCMALVESEDEEGDLERWVEPLAQVEFGDSVLYPDVGGKGRGLLLVPAEDGPENVMGEAAMVAHLLLTWQAERGIEIEPIVIQAGKKMMTVSPDEGQVALYQKARKRQAS